ncbi:MAG: DUF3619 family protein [Betaproteobacteria bacterium]|nr:DUF3619 family protein [Pseudomonadota bacterium]
MNEETVFANKIRKLLNQNLTLKSDQVERLRAAREQALTHQRTAQPALAMTVSDRVTAVLGGGPGFVSQMAMAVLFLVVGLIGITYWNNTQRVADIEEIDAALLTSDLPIDAYLDKGFDAWLKRSSP